MFANLLSFGALMQLMAAGVQGRATALLDLSVGSVLRAILEANAAIALWLQWLIVQVQGLTRAATSNGSDLDSWMADFALTRLPAAAASGTVVLSRISATAAAFVPVGANVRTADGSQTASITANPALAAFSANPAGYQVAAGVSAIALPATVAVAGSAGNIVAGALTVLATAIPGIDAATNPIAFGGGLDAESDAALRARFALYIQSRTAATRIAIAAAIAGVRAGLTYVISENSDAGGNAVPGSFLVTIDDGSGNPPASLLTAIGLAVDAVRPIGSVFAVRAPVVLAASIGLTLVVTKPAADPTGAATAAAVSAAIGAYVSGLAVGAPLAFSRIAQVAYDASPLVVNVTSVTLNGGTADLALPAFGVAKPGAITVAVA